MSQLQDHIRCQKSKRRQPITRECIGCFYLRKVNYGNGDKTVCGYKRDKEGLMPVRGEEEPKDVQIGPADEKERTKYSLLCHKRADAMLKGKLHEFKGLENELEAVDMLIKRIKPLGELRSTQVIASIITCSLV